jgi:hypothetical protein
LRLLILASRPRPAFLREPFKNTEFRSLCQPLASVFLSRPPSTMLAGLPPDTEPIVDPRGARYSLARRKISKNDQQLRPEPIGARKAFTFRVMQWLVLCGIPYRGCEGVAAASANPANQLPFSLCRQAKRPPGRSTAHLQLFESNTACSRLQPLAGPISKIIPEQLSFSKVVPGDRSQAIPEPRIATC